MAGSAAGSETRPLYCLCLGLHFQLTPCIHLGGTIRSRGGTAPLGIPVPKHLISESKTVGLALNGALDGVFLFLFLFIYLFIYLLSR